MTRRSWIQFSFLAAFWGASYLFIKVALEDGFSAPSIVFIRTALAALVLLPLIADKQTLAALRAHVWPIAVLALVQVAAPFTLISYGEQHISSSLTGILVATAPIFTFLLAIWIAREERARGVGIVGVGLGIAGVVLLLGIDAGGGTATLAGGLMVVLASLGYALGAFYLKRKLGGLKPVAVVVGTMAMSALMSAPLMAVDPPSGAPAFDAVASMIGLGVFGTGISFVLFYNLIGSVGPTKASLVAYVAPGFAVLYGVVLLGESFTAATLAGLVLIILGSYLAAEGRLPWQARRERAAAARASGGGAAGMSAPLAIRLSSHGDELALGRLARLDSCLYDGRRMLVAEVEGELVAAVPAGGGRAIADPFRRTQDAVALLELRRSQIQAVASSRPLPAPQAGRRLLRYLVRA